jgi:hypothetical protein
MARSAADQGGTTGTSEEITVPPAIRLVLAFKDAAEAAREVGPPQAEVCTVEGLLIAADAAFTALARFADLWHDCAYSDPPWAGPGEEQAVLDGYEVWLDAADPIRDRLNRLTETGYESEWAGRFQAHYRLAQAFWDDALARRHLERDALRADQLVELATRLAARPSPQG